MENELIWDETPLTTCQQNILRIIQQYGITTAEGVSMTTILQNARKEGITEKAVAGGGHYTDHEDGAE